jgi:methionyl aminopeptidase
MNDDVYEKYKTAGKIASDALKYGKNLIKTGVSFLEVAKKIESRITGKGAGLAFPVNIAVNEVAAHYSPSHTDSLVFKKGDVVKLDIGTHIDGYIADTASTVEVFTKKYNDLINASSAALDTVIDAIKPNIYLCSIGKIISDVITSFNYKPVENLTGHSLKRYRLHAGLSIPNVPGIFQKKRPVAGDVLAIEPFASNGAGYVVPGGGSNIYICKDSISFKIIRDKNSKIVFNKINKKFKTLPFAERWFEIFFPNNSMTLKKLSFSGLIKHYPQLIDQKNGVVTQKEHTVILSEEGCEVIT